MMIDLSLPLTLSIGLALFVLMIGVWQVPRIRVYLSGNHAAEPVKKDKFSGLKHWGKLLAGLVLFLVIGLFGEAWYWTQQSYEMAGTFTRTYEDIRTFTDKYETHKKKLPTNYTLKYLSWKLGYAPLPKLVKIPSGEVLLKNNESSHRVTLSKQFQVSQYEITFEQYDYFIWDINHRNNNSKRPFPYDENWGRDNRPVINVTWSNANHYSNWLSNKLNVKCKIPSMTQWILSGRAGENTNFYWGNEPTKKSANCQNCGNQWDNKQTAPVGSFKPNTLGLYDIHGNVSEWVQDKHYNNINSIPPDGTAWEVETDTYPGGRYLLGGSWANPAVDMSFDTRVLDLGVKARGDIGFRVACSID